MTKVRFISLAPWLIMLTLVFSTARNSRAATPGLNFRLSPTTQTIALPVSTETCADGFQVALDGVEPVGAVERHRD